jgi:hypothetical protein
MTAQQRTTALNVKVKLVAAITMATAHPQKPKKPVALIMLTTTATVTSIAMTMTAVRTAAKLAQKQIALVHVLEIKQLQKFATMALKKLGHALTTIVK